MTYKADNRMTTAPVTGAYVSVMGETYFRINNYDAMPPFFITVVSSDDHWIFVSTTGGLTAGRINANHALFPYYTEDKIAENASNTGPKSILHVTNNSGTHVWEPFIPHHCSPYRVERALYKNIPGTALIFEETNVDLGLVFRYAWRPSATFGIVKTAWLINKGSESVSATITDGIQNILPAHVVAGMQNELSALLDAYKRNELEPETGLGLFSLSSRLTDLAEPSESLRVNTVWQVGLNPSVHLLSSAQLTAIRRGNHPQTETDIRGQRGAYFVHDSFDIEPNAERTWHLVAEVNQDGAAVANLMQQLRTKKHDLYATVEQDIEATSNGLKHIVGGADGFQVSGNRMSADHHFANVLFNVMRGGTFVNQYQIDKDDLLDYIHTHDHQLLGSHSAFFTDLPDKITIQDLKNRANAEGDTNLIRLCYTYLPLTFSRRHGDPSRPWNRFSIHLKNPDGSVRLNYEGNWRDIFQNWEALAFSYPEFIEGMLAVFLNATTADGYNPYRITRDGIDWEVPEPDNPWANIGYWSDHQIIYLQKLMEVCERFYPGKLQTLLNRSIFAYANVPYRIKVYDDIVQDPYNTIIFDWQKEHRITEQVEEHGTDGKLLFDRNGQIFHVTLAEKLLNLLLAKLVNFVPEGGIWMNTQRPEWNDANNALVGKGLSVVTVGYLRRFVAFFQAQLDGYTDELTVTRELYTLFAAIRDTFKTFEHVTITDKVRRDIMDALGKAGSNYRERCYTNGFYGDRVQVSSVELNAFLSLVQDAIDNTIRANKRDDALYHAYNTLQFKDYGVRVNHLYPMLEGQVSVLSSGLLTPEEVAPLLKQLRHSALYRKDQHSYILYPDQQLPGFIEKNTIDESIVSELKLVQVLIDQNDSRLVVQDINGQYHLGGDLRNARDVQAVLDDLGEQADLADLVAEEAPYIHTLFEQIFKHDKFTGRSGTFFAYEGLGSIYWHMVSKLLLAAQENVYNAIGSDAFATIVDAYYDIRAGLGFNKSPDVYGAFPFDPYSHTPRDQGAKQPGMTGMVKEEILTRLIELGIIIENGEIVFQPLLLQPEDFLETSTILHYWDAGDTAQQLEIPSGALAFTFCRVPIVVQKADENQFILNLHDGTQEIIAGHRLNSVTSQRIFSHGGFVHKITVTYKEA